MEIKSNLKEVLGIARKEGIIQALRCGKIKYSRHIGPKEVKRMPELEQFLAPLIKEYQNKKTLHVPLEKEEENIFVCWWDGFDKAPRVVRYCLEKMQEFYGSKYQIHLVDRHNYSEFANIDNIVLKKFEERQISIQTLTDILRVRLLFENGGYWIDSTILLDDNYPLFAQLRNESFDSFFATTPNEKRLIEYKGKTNPCLSSFLGGRKGSVIYGFVYDSFLKWLKEKKSLPPYFLLDMILTLAMVYDLDDGAVNKIVHHTQDIGFVQKNENKPYNEVDISEMEFPQKLNWRSKGEKGSFLDALLSDFYRK